jgi:hypothetical protein
MHVGTPVTSQHEHHGVVQDVPVLLSSTSIFHVVTTTFSASERLGAVSPWFQPGATAERTIEHHFATAIRRNHS